LHAHHWPWNALNTFEYDYLGELAIM